MPPIFRIRMALCTQWLQTFCPGSLSIKPLVCGNYKEYLLLFITFLRAVNMLTKFYTYIMVGNFFDAVSIPILIYFDQHKFWIIFFMCFLQQPTVWYTKFVVVFVLWNKLIFFKAEETLYLYASSKYASASDITCTTAHVSHKCQSMIFYVGIYLILHYV